ncbi:MAG: amidohydrolase family protein [Deltaproteobacteria bacterium]|nr:amidohydrolase family protein [Deltaproteobacteria bacterium]
MLKGYSLFDADAHVNLSPRMWEDLPAEYSVRRPRPVTAGDAGMGRYNTGWMIDGQIIPRPTGRGAQPANTPSAILEEFGAPTDRKEFPLGSRDLSDPEARLRDMDRLGIDSQVLFPSTLYARMTSDAGFESALWRSYNRYMGNQCQRVNKRIKWAALLPLRETRKAFAALEEIQSLGASAAVVFGTAGDLPLSHPSFSPIWDEFARTGLPLCVHMGMSYPPFEDLSTNIFTAHAIGMGIPGQLAFAAVVGQGMVDRYPDMKFAFLEFGAEWMLYMVQRMDHYLPLDKGLEMPGTDTLPRQKIQDYVRSGRIFVAPEADDVLLPQEINMFGEDQILYASDVPHNEGRENAALEILERDDLSADQKRKFLYDNTVRFFGRP